MKKFKKYLIIILSLVFIPKVNAASNPYKEYSSYGINCTWYAWKEVYNRLGIALPGWGNAKDWYRDAQNSGYAVGSTPKANSIVVWDNFEQYGHVAFVDHVEGTEIHYWDSQTCYREMTEEEQAIYWDCIINETVSEEDSYKCDHLKVKERIPCRKSGVVGADNLIGYIYVTEKTNNVVSTPTEKKKPTKTETTSKNETTSKDDKTNKKEEPKVEETTEDSVEEVVNEEPAEEQPKDESKIETKETKEKNENKNKKKYIIIGSVVGTVILIGIIFIIIKIRRKKHGKI